jgi:GTP-binding protein LepA
MIFDSVYDAYRGVVTYVRMVDGKLAARAHPDDVHRRQPRAARDRRLEPEPVPSKGLGVGEVGYLITGVKDVRQSKVGDTITTAAPATERSPATPTRSRWSSAASTRSTAATTRTCARRSTS